MELKDTNTVCHQILSYLLWYSTMVSVGHSVDLPSTREGNPSICNPSPPPPIRHWPGAATWIDRYVYMCIDISPKHGYCILHKVCKWQCVENRWWLIQKTIRTYLSRSCANKMRLAKIPDSAHVDGARLQACAKGLLREKGVIQSYNLASFPGSPGVSLGTRLGTVRPVWNRFRLRHFNNHL